MARRLASLLLAGLLSCGLARRVRPGPEPLPPGDDLVAVAGELAAWASAGDEETADIEELQRALRRASEVLEACLDFVADCGDGARALVDVCTDVVGGHFAVEVRVRAVAVLKQIIEHTDVGPGELQRIVEVCDEAIDRGGVPHEDLLSVMSAVSRSQATDMVTVNAAIVTAVRLIAANHTHAWDVKAAFFFNSIATVARLARRMAAGTIACPAVIPIANHIGRTVLNIAELIVDHSGVTCEAQIEAAFVELLGVAEACAGALRSGVPDIADNAAELLAMAAQKVGLPHLGRLTALLASMGAEEDRAKVVQTFVVHRLIVEDPEGLSRGRHLELLAQGIAAQQVLGSKTLCKHALKLLWLLEHESGPSQAPGFRIASILAAASPLSPELALHVERLAPMPTEDAARSVIIGLCVRDADRVPLARPLLNNVCLTPRSVGLRAAEGFAAIASASPGRIAPIVHPWDFAEVGRCLGRAADGPDALEAACIASTLLACVEPLARRWQAEHRRRALRTLCRLAGGVHVACAGGAAA